MTKMTKEQRKAWKAFDADLLRIPKDEPDPAELRKAHEAFTGDALRIDPKPVSTHRIRISLDISVSVSESP